MGGELSEAALQFVFGKGYTGRRDPNKKGCRIGVRGGGHIGDFQCHELAAQEKLLEGGGNAI